MNKKKEIAAALAHEIKNPIAVIKANFDYIKLNNDLKATPSFKIIDKELDKLNNLINDYTTILQPIKYKEKIFIEDLVFDIIEELTISSDNNINFTFDLEDDTYIYGDYTKISILLFNIYKNAIEANSTSIKTKIFKDDKHIHIIISDNGIGINEDVINNIGIPFFTTKEKGTGLGVMICQSIVKSHQGSISITNNKKNQKGCSVKIRFHI